MKIIFKKVVHNFYSFFLIFYALVMTYHAYSLNINFFILFLLALGFLLAIFAHAKKNYITIFLLLLHMSIEWFEWSQVGIFNNLQEGLFNVSHVIMDFIFLSHELQAHIKRKKNLVFAIVIFLLILISVLGHYVFLKSDLVLETIEPFVIGGILGCVLSHLFYHLKIGKKDKCCS